MFLSNILLEDSAYISGSSLCLLNTCLSHEKNLKAGLGKKYYYCLKNIIESNSQTQFFAKRGEFSKLQFNNFGVSLTVSSQLTLVTPYLSLYFVTPSLFCVLKCYRSNISLQCLTLQHSILRLQKNRKNITNRCHNTSATEHG